MLLNVSSFFKDLFESYQLDSYKIILPNFSTEVIEALIKFFYTGEIFLNESWIDEFVSLCHELKCEKIPVISDLMENHKMQENNFSTLKEDQTDVMLQDRRTENLTITRVVEVPKEEMEFDEYDNVETIFFNENECNDGEFIDRSREAPPIASCSDLKPPDEEREIKEEYLNVQYIEDNHYEMIRDSEKQHEEDPAEKKHSETSIENLEMTADDHKNDGVTRSLIFKHLQKSNDQQVRKPIKKNVVAPSITFPALAMNLNQLREEQNRFKKRLQKAINSCRDSGNSVKKASKMFGVPSQAIERNLRGFKNYTT